jgi:hypothetical protein
MDLLQLRSAIPSTGCVGKMRRQFYQRYPLQVVYVRLGCSYVGDAKNVKDLGCVLKNHRQFIDSTVFIPGYTVLVQPEQSI